MEHYLEKFIELSKIPRASGKEHEFSKFLVDFATSKGLRWYTDNYNNVVIWKDATNELAQKEYIGLQCHTDMVYCKEKTYNSFGSDEGINVLIDRGYLSGIGTSLGADNGIGIAYILAILDSNTLKHPPIECIFTTMEESTMNGARKLNKEILKSKKIISLDNQSDNQICIGSATNIEWKCELNSESITDRLNDMLTYELRIVNLNGGHAIFDIADKTRKNPIKVAIDIIKKNPYIKINKIISEGTCNKIPRECVVEISLSKFQEEKIEKYIALKNNRDLKIILKKIENNNTFVSEKNVERIVKFVYGFNQGVIKKGKKRDITVSTNIGMINVTQNNVTIKFLIRYNDINKGECETKKIEKIVSKYGFKIIEKHKFPGFKNNNRELLKIAKKNYINIFGKEAELINGRFCLECGLLTEKIDDLDIISIGPTIENSHTIHEKVSLESCYKIWKLLLNILETL